MRVRSFPGHQVGALKPPAPAAATRSAASALRRFARAQADAEWPLHGSAPLAVGFSGGADSTALLLAARRLWPGRALLALHVHHGLQPAADAFAEHALRQCAHWQVECRILPASVRVGRGDSLEEQARRARHACLQAAARRLGCAWLLLGQHADDQAETLLLALLRGAGPAGLAAMPAVARRGGVCVGRPLLGCDATRLRAELDAAGVPYVRDPMNEDASLRRVRIRRELLPALDALEPAWRRTLGRSAALCARAAHGLRQRAADDLQACRGAPGLRLQALRALDAERRAEVLRAWLLEAGLRTSAAHIDNLCRQLDAPAQRQVLVRVGAARLWREHGWLRCSAATPTTDATVPSL